MELVPVNLVLPLEALLCGSGGTTLTDCGGSGGGGPALGGLAILNGDGIGGGDGVG